MATWSRIGASSVVTVSSGNVNASLPAGTQAGDLLVASIAYRSDEPFSAPAGWVIAEQQSLGDTSTFSGIGSGAVAWTIRGESNPETLFTRSGWAVAMCAVQAFRDLDGGTIEILDSSSRTEPANYYDAYCGQIETVDPNTLLLLTFAGGKDTSINYFSMTSLEFTQSGATNGFTGAFPASDTWYETLDVNTTVGADTTLALGVGVKATPGLTGSFRANATGGSRHVMLALAFTTEEVVVSPWANTSVIVGG